MYKVYNMGHRMEIYCKPSDAQKVIDIAKSFGIEAKIVGRTEPSKRKDGKNHLTLSTGSEEIKYVQS